MPGFRAGAHRLIGKVQAQLWVYAELDRLYPPMAGEPDSENPPMAGFEDRGSALGVLSLISGCHASACLDPHLVEQGPHIVNGHTLTLHHSSLTLL